VREIDRIVVARLDRQETSAPSIDEDVVSIGPAAKPAVVELYPPPPGGPFCPHHRVPVDEKATVGVVELERAAHGVDSDVSEAIERPTPERIEREQRRGVGDVVVVEREIPRPVVALEGVVAGHGDAITIKVDAR
jgi:hypothetical protein